MVKLFGIIILFAYIGFEASAAAVPTSSNKQVPTISSCITSSLESIKNEAAAIVSGNIGDVLCGPQVLSNLNEGLGKVIRKAENCAGISCYLTIVPLFQSEIMASGLRCGDQLLEHGPFDYILKKAYGTINNCIVKPLA